MTMIRKHFLTGLIILLPIAVTAFLVYFAFNLLTKPLYGIISNLLNYYEVSESLSFLKSPHALAIFSKIASFIILLSLIIIAGSLGRSYFLNTILGFGDSLIHQIPIVNKIYKASQEVVNTLFISKSNNFSQVVLVPFPHERAMSIGFLTNENMDQDLSQEKKLSVFVPGTPNPTIGFMIVFKREQLIFLNMSVEEALKLIVSCGVAVNPKSSDLPFASAEHPVNILNSRK